MSKTKHPDPFAAGGFNGEMATDAAPSRAGLIPVYTLIEGLASHETRSTMPDTHAVAAPLSALSGDEGLITADRRLAELLIEARAFDDPEAHPELWDSIFELRTRISRTPAVGIAGAVVKLRCLLDPELGIECGHSPDDAPALRDVLAAIEREQGGEPEEDDLAAAAAGAERVGELRRRAAAIAAEFGGPLPEATDAGLLEAERRMAELRRARSELDDEFDWGFQEEAEIIEPILRPCAAALLDFIDETAPQGLAGIAVKLREHLLGTEDDNLQQILEAIETLAVPDVGGVAPVLVL